jgi:hypothetical protein
MFFKRRKAQELLQSGRVAAAIMPEKVGVS